MKWFSRLSLRRRREPAVQTSPTTCPKCGREMTWVEKYTMMGKELRTYRCDHCQEEHVVDCGIAMWKLMSDANKPESRE